MCGLAIGIWTQQLSNSVFLFTADNILVKDWCRFPNSIFRYCEFQGTVLLFVSNLIALKLKIILCRTYNFENVLEWGLWPKKWSIIEWNVQG